MFHTCANKCSITNKNNNKKTLPEIVILQNDLNVYQLYNASVVNRFVTSMEVTGRKTFERQEIYLELQSTSIMTMPTSKLSTVVLRTESIPFDQSLYYISIAPTIK